MPNALMATDGRYPGMFKLQAKGYADDPDAFV